jgi:hypothetical protein
VRSLAVDSVPEATWSWLCAMLVLRYICASSPEADCSASQLDKMVQLLDQEVGLATFVPAPLLARWQLAGLQSTAMIAREIRELGPLSTAEVSIAYLYTKANRLELGCGRNVARSFWRWLRGNCLFWHNTKSLLPLSRVARRLQLLRAPYHWQSAQVSRWLVQLELRFSYIACAVSSFTTKEFRRTLHLSTSGNRLRCQQLC